MPRTLLLLAFVLVAAVLAPGSNPTVQIIADGQRVTAGPIDPAATVTLSNGLVDVTLRPRADRQQTAGHHLELRHLGRWVDVTSDHYGDWTYVAVTPKTPPTAIDVLSATDHEVNVRWTFGNHTVPAAYTADGVRRSYPFSKTVWLRAGETGYYARVQPHAPLPSSSGHTEHEIGFGGIWGPATVSTPSTSIRTDLMPTHWLSGDVAWAQLDHDGDRLQRTVVPFPVAEMLVPRFSDFVFGSLYVRRTWSEPYGAYFHVRTGADPRSPSDVASAARASAPAEMPGR